MDAMWSELSIAQVAELVGGSTPSTKNSDNFGGDIPWITPKDLSNHQFRYIEAGSRNITERGLSSSSAKLLPTNSVLLSTRAPVGYVAIAKNPLSTNQGFRSLILKDGFDPEFVYYLLQHNVEYLRSHASGTTFAELSGTTLKSLRFMFPPYPEQRAIARILGALDDKIEANRKMNTTLESIAQALFQSWFVDFAPVHAKSKGRTPSLPPQIANLFPSEFENSSLGPIPKGWEVSHLSDICSLNPLRSLRQGEVAPYLDMKNMPTLGPCPNEVVNRKFTSGSRFENGDTLLARITPCLENGKTAYVQHLAEHQTGGGSTEFIVLRPHSPIPPIFAYYLARSNRFRSFAIRRMTGSSGRQRVDSGSLSGFSLAIPPDKIFIKFGKLLSPAMKGAHANAQNSRHLSQIRDSLLPKLLSGELRVKG